MRSFLNSFMGACRVLQPGNPQLSGGVPLGTPYPVLRYNGPSGYSMCSQFPCTREASTHLPSNYSWLLRKLCGVHPCTILSCRPLENIVQVA